MPVTINGDGSITGLSAGGLPAGSVTDATIAGMAASKLSGALPAISGASLTGLSSGLSMVDQWRITSSFDASHSAYITSNWARVNSDGFGQLGTGMTESSGEFTFPSTGIYLIDFRSRGSAGGVRQYAGIKIYTTVDNSSYSEASNSYDSVSSTNYYFAVACQHIFDVTSTSTHKCKFQGESNDTSSFHGDAGYTNTGVTFIRLGDT